MELGPYLGVAERRALTDEDSRHEKMVHEELSWILAI